MTAPHDRARARRRTRTPMWIRPHRSRTPAKTDSRADPLRALRLDRPSDFAPVTGREAGWKHTPGRPAGGAADRRARRRRRRVRLDLDVRVEALPGVGRDDARIGTPASRRTARPRKPGRTLQRGAAPADRAATRSTDRSLLRIDGTDARQARACGAAPSSWPMPNSRATVVLDHHGAAQYAENVEILVGDGADLTVVTVQDWADDAVHVGEPLRPRRQGRPPQARRRHASAAASCG